MLQSWRQHYYETTIIEGKKWYVGNTLEKNKRYCKPRNNQGNFWHFTLHCIVVHICDAKNPINATISVMWKESKRQNVWWCTKKSEEAWEARTMDPPFGAFLCHKIFHHTIWCSTVHTIWSSTFILHLCIWCSMVYFYSALSHLVLSSAAVCCTILISTSTYYYFLALHIVSQKTYRAIDNFIEWYKS